MHAVHWTQCSLPPFRLMCAMLTVLGSTALYAAPLPADVVATLDLVIAREIAEAQIAGAVVVIGDAAAVLYARAAGDRTVGVQAEQMTLDTIFDLASLTKPIATATAVLQMSERGMLSLDAPASTYWTAFGRAGKRAITVRHLLTHTSGLPAGVSSPAALRDRQGVLNDIRDMAPRSTPGEQVTYSDINYVVLGEIVQGVSGLPLDTWCATHIFQPLGMRDTSFRPARDLLPRVAPTDVRQGVRLRGSVHDPIAAAMGGVAGNAGLFASAQDLVRYAQSILRGVETPPGETKFLPAKQLAAFLTPATLAAAGHQHTLGWRVEPPLTANRYRGVPAGVVAHFGYTGTAIWIDLVTRRFAIVLTSRLYPASRGNAGPLRDNVLGTLASTIPPTTAAQVAAAAPYHAEAVKASLRLPVSNGPVRTGIDVLEAVNFGPLVGKRVALMTNRSGFDARGMRTIDALARATGVTLVRIFAPEHGLETDLDTPFPNIVGGPTGLPVISLYDGSRGMQDDVLRDIDLLVFDIQDAGVRFFTYIAMLGQLLESAASHRIPVIVLDRPNPLGANLLGGPTSNGRPRMLTDYHPLPLLHGMTVGELAYMFNAERHIGADLQVVPMSNYARDMRYAQTGLGWVPPSPNLLDTDALGWYPDVGLIEGANISVGRGTPTPFAVIGAPWLSAERLAERMRTLIPGLQTLAVTFVPTEGPYAGHQCSGLRLLKIEGAETSYRPGELGLALALALALALHQEYPTLFALDRLRDSVGSAEIWRMLENGQSIGDMRAIMDRQRRAFEQRRSNFLIY